MSRVRPGLWLAFAIVLGLLAVALGVGAFTRFDRDPPPDGSPEVREWNEQALKDARTSAFLGVGAAFSLFGCFACGQRWSMRKSQRAPPS